MQLHTFEQLFFHEEKFYFYFLLLVVLLSCFLNVSWHLWLVHLRECRTSVDHNVSRLENFPFRVKTAVNGTDCLFFSYNASASQSDVAYNASASQNDVAVVDSQPFVRAVLQCVEYYSKDMIYT